MPANINGGSGAHASSAERFEAPIYLLANAPNPSDMSLNAETSFRQPELRVASLKDVFLDQKVMSGFDCHFAFLAPKFTL